MKVVMKKKNNRKQMGKCKEKGNKRKLKMIISGEK